MKLPRQPTIRTWFVFTLLLAGNLAVLRPLLTPTPDTEELVIFVLGVTVPAVFAAGIAMIVRRPLYVGLACFVLRVAWFWVFVIWEELVGSPGDGAWIEFIVIPVVPELCLLHSLVPLFSLEHAWWLGLRISCVCSMTYALLSAILAGTCRLRDPTSKASEAALKEQPRQVHCSLSRKGLVALASLVAFALISVTAKRTFDQQQAIKQIRAAAGSVSYDLGNQGRSFTGSDPGPEWLVDSFVDVDHVSWHFDGAPSDADLAALEKLPRLRYLSLAKTTATDEGLRHLRALTNLETLYLDEAKVTDTGLGHLVNLTPLETLSISHGEGITDAGLIHLRRLTGLEELDLVGTQITDAGLVHLQHLRRLESLDLRGAAITDEGLVQLQPIGQLKRIALNGTQITDAGLRHLRAFPELWDVRLSCNKVSDAGLAHLLSLPELTDLHLDGTEVTGEGLALLQALPNLRSLTLGDKITDAGLVHLQRLNGLERLQLTRGRLSDEAIQKLKLALPKINIEIDGIPVH